MPARPGRTARRATGSGKVRMQDRFGLVRLVLGAIVLVQSGMSVPMPAHAQVGADTAACVGAVTDDHSACPQPDAGLPPFEELVAGMAVPGMRGLSAPQLAVELRNRLGLSGTAEDGATRDMWEAWLIINQILRDHGRSREAYLLRRNRFPGVDLDMARAAAGQWIAANPDAATLYAGSAGQGEGPATVVGRETAAAASDVAGAGTVGPATATTSWFRGAGGSGGTSAIGRNAASAATTAPLGQTQAQPRKDLYEFLKATTVIVLKLGPGTGGRLVVVAHGTGSFIAPGLVLTNTHVVEDRPGIPATYFLVANRTLGLSRAVLVSRGQARSTDPNIPDVGVDAAVLEVLDVRSKDFLSFTPEFTEGDMVVLSGFAGRANRLDKAFVELLDVVDAGVIPTAASIPSPKFSSGRIQAVFTDVRGEETVAADIEATQGASGSALVDSCGRLVALLYAVSTARVDKDNYVDASMYNYSASARVVTEWLDSARVPYTMSAMPCADE